MFLQRKSLRQAQVGVGLIELLISMFIGLLVMAGVVQLFSTSSQNAVASAGNSRIQENVRYAFSRIAEDVAQTGNLGCLSSPVNDQVNSIYGKPSVKNMLGLNAGTNNVYDFATIINGIPKATVDVTIGGNNIAAGTDSVRIRYASNTDRIEVASSDDTSVTVAKADAAGLKEDQIVLASNCSRGAIFMITGISDGVLTHAEGNTHASGSGQFNVSADKEVIFYAENGTNVIPSKAYLYSGSTGAYQYFIGTGSAAAGACNVTSAPENCALFKRDSGVNLELAQGVHDMQIEYGWNTANNQLFLKSAAQITDWKQVDRMRITLSFNSIENAAGTGNNVDALLTKTVSRMINLPNQL